jgi:Mlc titration factor MtfA (ptsG expression regulator)
VSWLRRRRRTKVRARPFPAEWSTIIERNVPYVGLLDEPDRSELRAHIQVFLDEKRFEGCGGAVIDDEVRVTIAAQACILLLHRDTDYYPLMRTIVVYPTAYTATTTRRRNGIVYEEGPRVRLGESWYRGAVILSWEDVKWGAACVDDGENVVLHEFAHQLDDEAGRGDGAPALARRSMYVAWARVLGREYADLSHRIARHAHTDIAPYAAESPAEFFAVVTEAFFEKPVQLRSRHPELYEQLAMFYQQNPARLWARDSLSARSNAGSAARS